MAELVCRQSHLGREDVARLQLVHPAQGLRGGQLPGNVPVPHEHHMLAVVGDILCVVLNDDDGLAVLLVKRPENLIDAVGVTRVQLGDRLVQNQHLRPQGHSPGQRQQMGLPAGELPDVVVLPTLQPAQSQSLFAARRIVLHGVVQAGVGGVVQYRGPHNLVFKVLVHISRLLGQSAHVRLQGVHPVHHHVPGKFPGDKVGDQPVEGLAKSGFPTAVVANDCKEIPFFHL